MEDRVGDLVVLKNGIRIPVVNGALGKPPGCFVGNMPVAESLAEGLSIRKISYRGCNTVVVKSESVPAEEFTGISAPAFFLERTVRYVPGAIIFIKTL